MHFPRFSLILLYALSSTLHAAPPAPQPNVIYILADDLGYGDLSCYGQKKFKTPNIDRLATGGLRFTGHYSGNTVCTPSRAVLMTGQHSGHCYARGNIGESNAANLDPAMTVLPEVFKAAGYTTGAYGKWGLGYTYVEGASNPLTHGFDEFCGWKSQMIAHTYYPSSYVLNGKEVPLDGKTYVHDIVMDKALEFIRTNAKAKKPFFCYIPTAVPHAAMHAPKELHEKWKEKLSQFNNITGNYSAGPDEKCPAVINPLAGFAAMMENLDNQVGQILDTLEETGVDGNTLVMFSSDNGAHLEGGHDPFYWNSTGGLRGHKRDMHEGGIRAPMLARWPGTIKPGQTTDHLSCFQDILPTVAELTGQPVPKQSDGISFLPLLRGDSKNQEKHEYLYWEFHKGKSMFSQAVRFSDWKAYLEKHKKMQIFDLSKDPFEKKDLAKSKPEIVEKMEAIIVEAHRPLPSNK